MMYGPQAALFAELFSTEVRYSGATLGYQIGVLLGGGFTPMIATALFASSGTSLSVAFYMAASCVISVICVSILHWRRMRETHVQQTLTSVTAGSGGG